ncbi:claspin isoform X2 [Diabrotica virgifera virgifera]|uniref:Claspin-like n=1 Tax=Diabrotica virgifera virgifera TaxID=50390 RepID=A0ABM5ILD6_DIAVI|nr:claspin isoform X2 [Diabrotica virgifera virgifera]
MEVLPNSSDEANSISQENNNDFKSTPQQGVNNGEIEESNNLEIVTSAFNNEINTRNSHEITNTESISNVTLDTSTTFSGHKKNISLETEISSQTDVNKNKPLSISDNESSGTEDNIINKRHKKKLNQLFHSTDSEDEIGARRRHNKLQISDKEASEIDDGIIKIKVFKKKGKKELFDSEESEDEAVNFKIINKSNLKKHLTVSDSESLSSDSSGSLKKNRKGKTNSQDKAKNMNTKFSANKIRKRITLLESDSENELPTSQEHLIDNFSSNQETMNRFADSDDENILEENSNLKNANTKHISNNVGLESSDSEAEQVTPHNKSFSDAPLEETPIYAVNSKGDLVREQPAKKSNNWTALCDSESSADEDNDEDKPKCDEDDSMSEEDVIKPVKYKKKSMPKEEGEPKKMSGKEAAELRKEIQSESQRMKRESNISLPYHRPKSFTLKEFLSRRPKLASAVPMAAKTPPSVAIKMSIEQLKVVSKNLQKRHKEVEEFYKSDSEEETEDDKDSDYVPPQSELDQVSCSKEDSEEVTDKDSLMPEDFENKVISENGENAGTTIDKCVITNMEVDDSTNAQSILTDDDVLNTDQSQVSYINNTTDKIGKEFEEKASSNNLSKDGDRENSADKTIEDNCDKTGDKLVENIDTLDLQSSMEYEFNLDDMEDNTENIVNVGGKEVHPQISDNEQHSDSMTEDQQKAYFAELDKEIENFGMETSTMEPEKPLKSKLELLKERLANTKPRLSNTSNNVIDLDTVAKPTEVTKLMERFAKHTAKKHIHKDKVKLNVISVESGGEIHKETVAIHVDDDEDTAIEEKPGVRLQKLRNELQSQIAQQRYQHWQNKSTKEVINDTEDPYKDEKSECGADDAILDDDEEEEMSESSEDEIDDENDERENEFETQQKKSAFIDDEADESDIEDATVTATDDDPQEDGDISEYNSNDEEEQEEDEDEKSDKENEQPNEVNEKGILQSKNDKEEVTPFKKPLRRILKAFTEDSDEDEDAELASTINNISDKLNKSNEDSNLTQDDYIPPYQPQNQETPIGHNFRERCNSDLKFCTPVSYITGLQNLTHSASKLQSPLNIPSPLKEADWHTTLQKKLFADSVITDSQAEAMDQLCSEKFPASLDVQEDSNEEVSKDNAEKQNDSEDMPSSIQPTTQDLLNTPSGDFQDLPSTQDLLNICSGEFTGISQVFNVEPSKNLVTHKLDVAIGEDKNLGEDQDMIISQLINEEELEAFKRKFDSPVMTHSQKFVQFPMEEEITATGGVIDSDEDDNILEVKKRKKNQKKLTFSDDESSEDEKEEEEEIDLHDDIEEDDDDAVADINYDSEENEVEYTEENGSKPLKMADFFEDEAELSESEWGSEDEDEKDLDTLEAETGDNEKIDEKQMKADLERIHLRRMLDDDTKEVKLLQEMLLDDGELHGTGRERQFRWKNIDSLDMTEEEKKNSDDETGIDEDESEEMWRRKRHEREMFLKEKQSQDFEDDDFDLLSGSEILKIGHKVMQKSLSSNLQGNQSTEKGFANGNSPIVKTAFSLVHKRGSFLSRGDEVLQRLAEYNKISTTSEVVTQKTKNSKNFLFQTVEVREATEKLTIFNKRKATDATPRAIKKLRLTDNLSPAINRKKKPSKPDVKAKLFGVS